MDDFEKLLELERNALERYVYFKVNNKADAQDIIQDIYLSAFKNFELLKSKDFFKPWLISIARNRCNDYYRKKAKQQELSFDNLSERELSELYCETALRHTVRETLEALEEKDRQILLMYFWGNLTQRKIAEVLKIPLGTVKSRLYRAKRNFKEIYLPHDSEEKGADTMKKLPEYLPEYTIEKSGKPPFEVKWEELTDWFIIPKVGERAVFGSYDMPSRKCDDINEIRVVGRAEVHGIEGVEIEIKHTDYYGQPITDITMVAQLTEKYCRGLAYRVKYENMSKYVTFLDGEDFMLGLGYGDDNCGRETEMKPRRLIERKGEIITCDKKNFLIDIVGRYTVTIGGKSFDTVCVMDIEPYDSWLVYEQFIDKNGRTILWRRYNRDERAKNCYEGKTWSERFPDNDRLIVNGELYVHEYDCVTDYIFN